MILAIWALSFGNIHGLDFSIIFLAIQPPTSQPRNVLRLFRRARIELRPETAPCVALLAHDIHEFRALILN